MIEKIKETAGWIEGKSNIKPEVGLILGSGLGVMADEISNPVILPYREIPNFPVSTVHGHKGQLVIGELEGKKVVAMQGRFHYYEGYSVQEISLPVRVFKLLGVKTLLVTNAAGGVNRNFKPGDLMLISDHINLMGVNPLRGKNVNDLGPRFPDMTEAYNRKLIEMAERTGAEKGIITRKGVYAGLAGPSYETPAEIRFLAAVGADAVGMSTVPEVITAGHMGLNVLGVSCITNMAAGILAQPLNHEEVMETAEKVREKFSLFIKSVLKEL